VFIEVRQQLVSADPQGQVEQPPVSKGNAVEDHSAPLLGLLFVESSPVLLLVAWLFLSHSFE